MAKSFNLSSAWGRVLLAYTAHPLPPTYVRTWHFHNPFSMSSFFLFFFSLFYFFVFFVTHFVFTSIQNGLHSQHLYILSKTIPPFIYYLSLVGRPNTSRRAAPCHRCQCDWTLSNPSSQSYKMSQHQVSVIAHHVPSNDSFLILDTSLLAMYFPLGQ